MIRSLLAWLVAKFPLRTVDIADSAITSAKIADGTIVNADINSSAAIAITKLANGVDGTTYTPSLVGGTTPGSNTHSVQSGIYWRLGKLVVVIVNIALSAKDTTPGTGMSGAAQVTLPVYSANVTNQFGGAYVFSYSNVNLSAGYSQLGAYVTPNTDRATLIESGDNVGAQNINDTSIASSTVLRLVAIYSAA